METIGAAPAEDGQRGPARSVVEVHSVAVGGRAQGAALTFGQGRVVVLGEAGMLSAQVATVNDPPRTTRFGMNVPGYDNRQFLLNILHWLSGLLPR